ncbi:MAG: hypothetical protein QOK05_1455 [Chloroflexota bacterium]|jgi:hypothetical protein|nr:hypothetical protein [Chloroflexota bacterium]
MSRRSLFYVRVLVLVLGFGLALVGVLASGGPYDWLTVPLAVTGVLLLAGSMLVGLWRSSSVCSAQTAAAQ